MFSFRSIRVNTSNLKSLVRGYKKTIEQLAKANPGLLKDAKV
jgi:hypothetical protein